MRSPWWLVCVLWAVSAVALGARKPAPGQAEAEAGIHVAGTIVVGPEGKPLEYELTGANRLPAEVRRFLDFHIPRWEFDPPVVDGKPVALRNRMGLYLVARPSADGGMRIVLQAASFTPVEKGGGYDLAAARMPPPPYPEAAAEIGVEATVYLVLKVGPDGKVLDAADEQVNLHFLPERDADKRRDIFARAAVRGARSWKFNVPTQGPEAGREYWLVRVPLAFTFDQRNRYGEWQAYVPGPRRKVPWVPEDEQGGPLEAMAGGSVNAVGARSGVMLTPAGRGL
ncbi:energy transducer TonB [Pseudoxanthomonas sp. J31]|uniref:energy transducer TonB n=1 Tax=Pseudoxanthomonas sp. J31 TaxID=935851 RepID=UPI001E5AD303|nr:energy transducer TonB [Pseudoxanthomonas sp. J31]